MESRTVHVLNTQQQHTSVEGCTCSALCQREDEALARHDLHDLGPPVQVLQPPGVDVAKGEGVKLRLRNKQQRLSDAQILAMLVSSSGLCNTSEAVLRASVLTGAVRWRDLDWTRKVVDG